MKWPRYGKLLIQIRYDLEQDFIRIHLSLSRQNLVGTGEALQKREPEIWFEKLHTDKDQLLGLLVCRLYKNTRELGRMVGLCQGGHGAQQLSDGVA